MTTIVKCTCKSAFQDDLYGKGNRVHNIGGKDPKKAPRLYCTVCSPSRRLARIDAAKVLDGNRLSSAK